MDPALLSTPGTALVVYTLLKRDVLKEFTVKKVDGKLR
jgi:hypothetical protein